MDITDSALKYLSLGMKTEKQVRDYLIKKQFSSEDISDTVLYLKELKYIDDVSYSATAFRVQYEKGRAKGWIVHYLKGKGVNEEDIGAGYFQFMDTEEGRNLDEIQVAVSEAIKIVQGKKIDKKLKTKIAGRLSRRGFTASVIYKALDELEKCE